MKHIYIKSTMVFSSLSALAMLSACDVSKTWDAFTGQRPDEQVVLGERHTPILNGPGAEKTYSEAYAPPAAAPVAPVMSQPAGAPIPAGVIADATAAAPVKSPVPASSIETDPFDYYDSSGNSVEPKAPTPANASPAAGESQGDFFGGLWDRITGKPAPKPATVPVQEQAVRKPLSENPYVTEVPVEEQIPSEPQPMAASASTDAPANGNAPASAPMPPLAAAPQTVLVPVDLSVSPSNAQTNESNLEPIAKQADKPSLNSDLSQPPVAMPVPAANTASPDVKPAVVETAIPALPPVQQDTWPSERQRGLGSMNTTLPTGGAAAVVADTAAATPSQGGQSWFGHLSGQPSEVAQSANPPEMKLDIPKDAAYSAPSSVPPTPPEFQAIKAEKQQDLQDLQNEQGLAQQQKQQLDNEPSQPAAVAPVEVPVPAATTPDIVVPLATPPMIQNGATPDSTAIPAGNTQVQPSDATVLLGHAATVPTPESIDTIKVVPPSRYDASQNPLSGTPAQ